MEIRNVDGVRVDPYGNPVTRKSPATSIATTRLRIRLIRVTDLRWSGQGNPAATDETGERDYGSMDSFEVQEGVFTLVGDFGTIEARSVVSPQVVLL
ncbi:hypothetical protein [Austwickia sp. TVS 96-490-7B]|uniref:hypothetical protein n=1 Tax=Austwickia sp. TVS 96-490-7B TaxID=2830843 RepID=UPI001C57D363|nr:hypothetical protein [Austwickia sp. TVS 96-490-7B]